MRVTISHDIDRVTRAITQAPEAMTRNVAPALDSSAQRIARDGRRRAPKAHTLLASSVSVDKDGPLRRIIGPGAAWGEPVETGVGVPGPTGRPTGKMPPLQSLVDWIRVKGITPSENTTERGLAFLIGRRIAEHGIEPQPYMEPSLAAHEADSIDRISAALERGLQEAGF